MKKYLIKAYGGFGFIGEEVVEANSEDEAMEFLRNKYPNDNTKRWELKTIDLTKKGEVDNE